MQTYKATHPEHGECIVDERQFKQMESLGYSIEGKPGSEQEAPVEASQPQDGEEVHPEVESLVELSSVVDDRALPGLTEAGITTLEALLDAYSVDPEAVLDLKYVTKRTIEKAKTIK